MDRTAAGRNGRDSLMNVPMYVTRGLWHRTGKRVVGGLSTSARVVRNAAMKYQARADYRRWASPQELQTWWDERTSRLAALIPPGSNVIEFGAGRRALEKLLPPGCNYTPSDLVDRGQGTIIWDLNDRPLPDLSTWKPDVAVFGGVLEYIRQVPEIVEWLSRCGVRCCISSYESVPQTLAGIRWIRDKFRRFSLGYMSGLSETEFIFAFERCGFVLEEQQTWTTQGIYKFVKHRP